MALRDALNAHPDAIPLFLARPTAGETAMAPLEALVAALASAGFAEMTLLRAHHTLFGFLMGFVGADLTGPASSSQPATLSRVAAEVVQLPESRFPYLRAITALAATSSSDAEFEYGLEAILQGLTALVPHPDQPQPTNSH